MFDKSFLQALSLDEAVLFDNFFLTNIPPVFFVETLADLAKNVRSGRTPEREVKIIADKTPERHVSPSAFHLGACIHNLRGYEIPLDGRILKPGGRPVRMNDQGVVFYEEAPEIKAFGRWQDHEFSSLERIFARTWRDALNGTDYHHALTEIERAGIELRRFGSLDELNEYIDAVLSKREDALRIMRLAMAMLSVPLDIQEDIFRRWQNNGYPVIADFAPYASYCLKVELFYYLSINAGLISEKKVSNKTDFAYLYYLPFCMMFVSYDRLHRRVAEYLLREDQLFVWGGDLKEDLVNLDEYYSGFPESEKEKGLYAIAGSPPQDGGFLVSNLWDRFMLSWRDRAVSKNPPTKSENSIVEHVNKITEAAKRSNQDSGGAPNFNVHDPDAIVLERRIHKRKGKWWQLPKDLEVTAED